MALYLGGHVGRRLLRRLHHPVCLGVREAPFQRVGGSWRDWGGRSNRSGSRGSRCRGTGRAGGRAVNALVYVGSAQSATCGGGISGAEVGVVLSACGPGYGVVELVLRTAVALGHQKDERSERPGASIVYSLVCFRRCQVFSKSRILAVFAWILVDAIARSSSALS